MRAIFRLSQPNRWLYLLGPYLLGVAAGNAYFSSWLIYGVLALHALYFTLPAGLWLRTVSNPKRGKSVTNWLFGSTVLWLGLISLSRNWLALGVALAFLTLSWLFADRSLGWSKKPVLDVLCGATFILPGLFGFVLVGGELALNRGSLAIAAWLLATGLFTALAQPGPTVKKLGILKTLGLSIALYGIATWAAHSFLGNQAFLLGGVYIALMVLGMFVGRVTWYDRRGLNPRERMRELNRMFPIFHILVGLNLLFTFLARPLG